MPRVLNKELGREFDVPPDHFSLNHPGYEVLDDGTHPVKDGSSETDLTDLEWLESIDSATDEQIDAFIVDRGIDIGRVTSRSGKIKKIQEFVSAA